MATGVSITDRAVEKIKQQLAAEKREGQGLRVKVVGGGCSGLQNKLDFDTSRAGDKVFEKDGAKVLVDMKSLLYLNGTELDYKEGLMQSGFALQNPKCKAVLWMWRLLYGLARERVLGFRKSYPVTMSV
jgi:iron-sulfur cluster assembly protein